MAQGSTISMVSDIRTILGTRFSVCSWIWVTACKTLMASPTRIETISTGAPTISARYVAFRTRSTAVSRSMGKDFGIRNWDFGFSRAALAGSCAVHARQQHADDAGPAIDQDE